MRILVERAALLTTLDLICRMTRGEEATKMRVVLRAGEGVVHLSAIEGAHQATRSLSCEVGEAGVVQLSARGLKDRVERLPRGCTVEVATEEGPHVRVAAHGMVRRFGMLARVEEEVLPSLAQPGSWLDVDGDAMLRWLRACEFAASEKPEEVAYIGELRCVSIGERTGLQLRMTDGYRVATDGLLVDAPADWPNRVGVSLGSVKFLISALDKQEQVRLSITERHVFLSTPRGEVCVQTADCRVPFDQFFALARWQYALRLPRSVVEMALAGLSLAVDGGGGVEWHVFDNGLVRWIVRDEKRVVVAEEEGCGEWEGAPCPMVAKLRCAYVLEAVQSIADEVGDFVMVRWSSPLQPFVIDAGGLASCIVNPMRVE